MPRTHVLLLGLVSNVVSKPQLTVDANLDKLFSALHSAAMGKMDQGLGAIGGMLLTVAFALLLTIGVPISVSKETVELKDWLGFAGNIVGALVTLFAAVLAWRAVQRQIGVQQEANLLAILTREEDRLESALTSLDNYGGFADRIKAIRRPNGEPPQFDFYGRLLNLGLSTEANRNRQFLMREVGLGLPPDFLWNVSSELGVLVRRASEYSTLREMHVVGADDPPNLNGEIQQAQFALDHHLRDLQFHIDILVKLSKETTEKLTQYRTRIERSLSHIEASKQVN